MEKKNYCVECGLSFTNNTSYERHKNKFCSVAVDDNVAVFEWKPHKVRNFFFVDLKAC